MAEYCDSIDRGDLDACAALFRGGRWGIAGDLATARSCIMVIQAVPPDFPL